MRRLPALLVGLLLILSGCATPSGSTVTTMGSAPADRDPAPSATAKTGGQTTKPKRPAAKPSARQRQVTRLLARVRITERRPFVPGYDRSCDPGACQFGASWSDAHAGLDGHNGCRTRDDVLRRQLKGVEMRFDDPTGCRVYSGTLHDPYSGRSFPYRGNWLRIEIDHVVPLAAAWHTGASTWSQQRRINFANDVRRNLLAVDEHNNQDKGSQGPDRWLPPNLGYRCAYVTRYLRVVDAWGLSISRPEAAAIRRVAANRCR